MTYHTSSFPIASLASWSTGKHTTNLSDDRTPTYHKERRDTSQATGGLTLRVCDRSLDEVVVFSGQPPDPQPLQLPQLPLGVLDLSPWNEIRRLYAATTQRAVSAALDSTAGNRHRRIVCTLQSTQDQLWVNQGTV